MNSLYPTVMIGYGGLPTGAPEAVASVSAWNDPALMKAYVRSLLEDKTYAYQLSVDYTIPEDVQRATDDYPLSVHHDIITKERTSAYTQKLADDTNYTFTNVKTLLASHLPQNNYKICLERLDFLIEMGVNITKIRKITKFKKENFLEKFINKCVELRKNSNSLFEKNLYKLLMNSLFGKFLFNNRKNSLSTKLVTNENHFRKLASSPLLKEVYMIDGLNSHVIMKSHSENITLKSPIHIGWFILELSKDYMYRLFYDLKKKYPKELSLVYSDTDSFLLQFEGLEFMKEIRKKDGFLASMMDLSNMSDNADDLKFKGQLGKLKSETGPLCITKFLGAQPKNYITEMSDMTGDVKNKGACKGINRSSAPVFEQYQSLYNECEQGNTSKCTATVTNIRSNQCALYTTRTRKSAIMYMDKKRFYPSINESYGYGHPDFQQNDVNMDVDTSPQPSRNIDTTPQPSRNKRKREDNVDSTMDFNQKKLKKVNGPDGELLLKFVD